MPFDEARDERAEWHDVEALTACVVQRRLCQAAPEAAALARLVYLGVRECDAALPAPVCGQPHEPPAKPQLVAAGVRDVDDLGLSRRAGGGLELVGAAEVLD